MWAKSSRDYQTPAGFFPTVKIRENLCLMSVIQGFFEDKH
jgi:hypothetical protein